MLVEQVSGNWSYASLSHPPVDNTQSKCYKHSGKGSSLDALSPPESMPKIAFLKLALFFVGLLALVIVMAAVGGYSFTSKPTSVGPFPSSTVTQPKVNEPPTLAATPTSPTPTETGISREEVNQLIPLHPYQVTVETTPGTVVVGWSGTGEDTIQYYEVYRKSSSGDDWQKLGDVKSVGENKGQYEWRDTSTKVGTVYIYGVRAVSIYGTKSVISESAAITSQ